MKVKQVELNHVYGKWKTIECIEPFREEDNFKGVWKVEDVNNPIKTKTLGGQYLLTIEQQLLNGYYDNVKKNRSKELQEEIEQNFIEDVANDTLYKNSVCDSEGKIIGNLCRMCHKIKLLNKFRSDDGAICLDCAPYVETSYGDPVNIRRPKLSIGEKRIRQQYSSICTRDKKHNRNTTITIDDLKQIDVQPCFYCGGYSKGGLRGQEGWEKDYNGVDRIDSNIGHTKENVVSCCNVCNIMRGNLKVEDWIESMERVVREKDRIYKELNYKGYKIKHKSP